MRSSSRLKATRREALAGWAERIAQDPNNVETHNNRRVFYFREVPYPSARSFRRSWTDSAIRANCLFVQHNGRSVEQSALRKKNTRE